MVAEFRRLQRDRVQPAELQGAQDFMTGHFPLSIETPSAIAEQVLAHLFYGQKLSDIETYLDRVSEVTADDIERVARRHVFADRLTIVLVGDAAAFRGQLRGAGFPDVEEIPLSELDVDAGSLRRGAPRGGTSATP
jgi:predicted Zn-dependent peptidase